MEALQQDLVAVLPTGAGKTLIASLWLKRMRELNPEKMGLFVVDRIPLVLQQKKVAIPFFVKWLYNIYSGDTDRYRAASSWPVW